MAQADLASRQLLLDALFSVGYGEAHIELDWSYPNLSGLTSRQTNAVANRLDIAAFGDERRHDWETSAIVCDLQSLEVLNDADEGFRRSRLLFESTAASNVIFGGRGRDYVDFWLGCESNSPKRVEGVCLDAQTLNRAFSDHRDLLERESLTRIRGGQRHLFDRVYEARRDELADFLHEGLQEAIKGLRAHLNGASKDAREALELSLAHVAMALLAARIMEDKDLFGLSKQMHNARQLLAKAQRNSNGFFGHVAREDLRRLEQQLGTAEVDGLLQTVLAHLTGPACFSLITPEMLSDLYERALIANGHSGRQSKVDIKGIHYTPYSLAKQILSRIPIEEIPPSERLIVDIACGSGSFLMAATARLKEAYDPGEFEVDEDLTTHLKTRVWGNDRDGIAILVTKMRYLLQHWIETGSPDGVPTPTLSEDDGLSFSVQSFDGLRPSVIVGNPPFNPHKTSQRFVRHAVDLLTPGGFFGMIMPGGFLTSPYNESPETRDHILRNCELLEVVEMPDGVVGSTAEHATCLLIARKARSIYQHPSLFRQTFSRQKDATAQCRDHYRFTFSFASNRITGSCQTHWRNDPCPRSKGNDASMCRIVSSPVDDVFSKLVDHPQVMDLCGESMILGIKARGGSAVASNERRTGYRPYLQHQARISPFFLEESDWQEDRSSKGAFIDPRTALIPKEQFWPIYEGPKVVLAGSTNKNSAVQSVAAVDFYGIFPEDHVRCLAISSHFHESSAFDSSVTERSVEDLLLWLCAIINSPTAQAWIAAAAGPRGLTSEVLTTLPLPRVFDERIVELIKAARGYSRLERNTPVWSFWSNWKPDLIGRDLKTIAGQINNVVACSYGITAVDNERLCWFLRGMTNPWVNDSADAHVVTYAERRVRGTMVGVDINSQVVEVVMPRYSKSPIHIPLPRDIPGWALAPGAEFTCLAPRNDRDRVSIESNPWLLRDFKPLPYAYLSVERLEQLTMPAGQGG